MKSNEPQTDALIKQVPLFSSLPPTELEQLAMVLRPVDVVAGSLLFREGDLGDRFYIVLAGQIEIIKALGLPGEYLANVRGPGEYIGEMSLFKSDGLRTASAKTRTATQLLEMTQTDFKALLARQPMLAYELVRVLTTRLEQANNTTVIDLQEKNRQLTEAYHQLQAAQAQVIEKEKLEHELQVASEVQASLLPSVAPAVAGWGFAMRWRPAREVSGDFYDFIPLTAGQELGVVIADVSDKGMPAALFMALSRSILRASLTHNLPPAGGIVHANGLICTDAAKGMFVTLFYGQLVAETGRFTYVNAGHNRPLWYRARYGDVVELQRTGPALGMLKFFTYEQIEIEIDPGDCLVLYTDGVTEARDPQAADFGVDRLRACLVANSHLAAEAIARAVEQELDDFIGADVPLRDDITLVVMKRLPSDVSY